MTLEQPKQDGSTTGEVVVNLIPPNVNSRIIDAVIDQDQGQWFCYGTPHRSSWFSMQEFHTNEKEVFSRLAGPGMPFATSKSKNALKTMIDNHQGWRTAIVAARPGWCSGYFVLGDGSVVVPDGRSEQIIITFETDPKFTPTGTLREWMEDVGKVVHRQPIPLFLLAYSFVAPILRFAPYSLNPQVELVGPPETGKSTLAVLAASVWAGDPTSDAGGGENWNSTAGGLAILKACHSDTLLMLDEANLAGTNTRNQSELIKGAIFTLAAKGGRTRYTDATAAPNIHTALLSTSNEPFNRIVQASRHVADAMRTRMITIEIGHDHSNGVLDHVPKGYNDTQSAMSHLRDACDHHYGHAGRRFLKHLVKTAASDEAGLKARIQKLMEKFLKELASSNSDQPSARVRQVFAITYAAGFLAREWGCLPKEWGALKPRLIEVFQSTQQLSRGGPSTVPINATTALKRVRDYVDHYEDEIIPVNKLPKPKAFESFKRSAGFLLRSKGRKSIIIPSKQFQHEFQDHQVLMRELRAAGKAKTETGKRTKLTVKTPRRICEEGRVYWIYLD